MNIPMMMLTPPPAPSLSMASLRELQLQMLQYRNHPDNAQNGAQSAGGASQADTGRLINKAA